jgi:perosamine synthetase
MNSRNEVLAIHGGPRSISKSFKPYNSIQKEEIRAVKAVMKSGVLSKFLGTSHQDFYGGPQVLQFENECSRYFGVKHAISVNSWTSGLIAAVGAVGISPGDEVIVTPWTMSATAMAIIHWGGIPVFADIDPKNFCISPESIANRITPRTRAIMSVDIFGMSAEISEIMDIARKHNLKVISDTAQSPGAMSEGKKSGTLSHIGGISLNYHKHIHTGEGGVLFTDDDDLALRMKLIRNHAESVVGGMQYKNLTNMVGYNFRMGEIEAAIGLEQLKKLDSIITKKQELANLLTQELQGLKGLATPEIHTDFKNVYYVYPMVLNPEQIKVPRRKIVDALREEGVPNLVEGYVNLHRLPIFREKIALGNAGFPWNLHPEELQPNYSEGTCPNAERLQDETFFAFAITGLDLNSRDINLIGNAFRKVWSNLEKIN